MKSLEDVMGELNNSHEGCVGDVLWDAQLIGMIASMAEELNDEDVKMALGKVLFEQAEKLTNKKFEEISSEKTK